MRHGDVEEKAWVRVVGLPMHLWSQKILKKIADACGGFLAMDEDTMMLSKLCGARMLVKVGVFDPSNFVKVVVGGYKFLI